QSPKNPMSDKASYSNVRALVLEEDNPTNDLDLKTGKMKRYLFDYLKMANMVNLVVLLDPGQVSSQSGMLSKHLSDRLKNTDGVQLYLVPYNPGGHWVLIILRPAKETVYYMDSLPNCFVDEDMRNIVNT
ncbi:PREDICTED: PRUPE_6G193600, partial [Prunus dulcis]